MRSPPIILEDWRYYTSSNQQGSHSRWNNEGSVTQKQRPSNWEEIHEEEQPHLTTQFKISWSVMFFIHHLASYDPLCSILLLLSMTLWSDSIMTTSARRESRWALNTTMRGGKPLQQSEVWRALHHDNLFSFIPWFHITFPYCPIPVWHAERTDDIADSRQTGHNHWTSTVLNVMY